MTKREKERQAKIESFIAQVKADRNGALTLGDTQKIVLYMEELQRKDNLEIVKNLKRKAVM